ncbi:hypothetical protein GIS00_13120 [Nakamurella sp. YIM 132087]|uniref:B3/B4 tRNA-binding domain-containing protein n=1 Tax=Nakamurella alba TaxID=2665158 RepID=A0A7K1FL62_9ACTN|nr:phenylalanine--tRNA ligase beta subunit-related protein [Nakamurella alba]MTD14881.1 hypothetical protein [Nakamurella alba]
MDGQAWLDGARVDPAVFELRGDYSVVLITAEGLTPGPSDAASGALLDAAAATVAGRVADTPVEELPEIAAWREAFRSFGAKPQRTRPSVEALVRRAADLPRIDRITDTYNAISVGHLLPLGGEDLDAYAGPPVLTRADGSETFDIVKDGGPAVEHPDPGEVIWRDDAGVTCRRWNWRQCVRTRITEQTRNAGFILDGLGGALGPAGLEAAATALENTLSAAHSGVVLHRRTIGASG